MNHSQETEYWIPIMTQVAAKPWKGTQRSHPTVSFLFADKETAGAFSKVLAIGNP